MNMLSLLKLYERFHRYYEYEGENQKKMKNKVDNGEFSDEGEGYLS